MAQSLGHQEAQQGTSAGPVEAIPQGLYAGEGRRIQPQGHGRER